MSSVKEAGGNPDPATAASVAADSRIARKIAQMEAGQVLIAEAAKYAAETKERLEQESAARKEERKESRERAEEKRDTPELSRQSKWFGTEGKILKEANIPWMLEQEPELLEALQRWMPADGGDLSIQLRDLSKLYLALLDAVLTHTIGEEQAVQLERLNQILSQKLNLILDVDLNELMRLLEETGQTETLGLVKSSVYKQTTGEPISGKAADRFYALGGERPAGKGNSRYFMPESQVQGTRGGVDNRGRHPVSARTASVPASLAQGMSSENRLSAAAETEGRLYGLDRGGNVRINQEFEARMKSGEMQMSRRNQNLGRVSDGGGRNPDISAGKMEITGKELEKANRFAAHIGGSGNLLRHPDISARNEELTGLLAALTSIKAQVYAANAGRDSALKGPVKSAVHQLVDYYLAQKGVYKVYHYTTNIYEKTGSPQKAVEEGLAYAYKIFQEKKEDAAYQRQEAYSERAGFFRMLPKDQNMRADLSWGMRLLEENWREFLKSIGAGGKKGISLKAQKHSPWGMLMEPEDWKKDGSKEKEKLLLTEVACAALLLAGYLCYRLFFG